MDSVREVAVMIVNLAFHPPIIRVLQTETCVKLEVKKMSLWLEKRRGGENEEAIQKLPGGRDLQNKTTKTAYKIYQGHPWR